MHLLDKLIIKSCFMQATTLNLVTGRNMLLVAMGIKPGGTIVIIISLI